MSFSEQLKKARLARGYTQQQVADAIGITKSTYCGYETNKRKPDVHKIKQLADFLHTSGDVLLETGIDDSANYVEGSPLRGNLATAPDNIMPMPAAYTVPLLGTIACGEPILAAENIEDNVEVPEHIHADFALRCKGDSMINARIHDGDIVYIRQQPAVNNGEIAAVLIGDEATLKRVYVYEDHVVLQPENPAYEPLVYFKDAMQAVRILGKAVGFTSLLP